jgi:hypothetical protein
MIKEKKTENWVTVEKFREYYDLSPSYAYQLVNAKDFPAIRLGVRRGIRVDLNKTDEYFEKHFNTKY